MFNFVVDSYNKGRAGPALARHTAEPYTQSWREFGSHYPYTVPADLIAHCDLHSYPYSITTLAEFEQIIADNKNIIENNHNNYLYPVQFGWFDHGIDYVNLLPETVKAAIRADRIRILFYYHEGDNPLRIKRRLDLLCEQNNIPNNAYVFVSGNTEADNIPQCIHFCDHELLYYFRNQSHEKFFKTGVLMRDHLFLALNRTHKWWRATVMSDLSHTGLLAGSLWSYNTVITVDDRSEDNPIEISRISTVDTVMDFIHGGPYSCDDLSAATHNDHSLHTSELYDNSYCSIILETLFDVDGSNGAFLTEKTFKCLKHGHPFVLIGGPGSLQQLRNMGYRVFDSSIDNSYDLIQNNTDRYLAARRSIAKIASLTAEERSRWFESLLPDLLHNSQLFASSKWDRLNSLQERIYNVRT